MNFSDFARSISEYPPDKILFVAIGNELRSDDGISREFIDHLKETNEFRDSDYLFVGINPENYLTTILDFKPDLLVFIDAARFGGNPGDVKWLDNKTIDSLNISTHAFSMKLVEKYLLLEREIEIKYFGIEPYCTNLSNNISPKLLEVINNFFNINQSYN